MKIIGTGLSGMVGSRITKILSGGHQFTNLSLETGIDITDAEKLAEAIKASDATWIFHFAAKTDVDGCESDRKFGENSAAWKINVTATANIAENARITGKNLLYISTDFVFDGTKESYDESDSPNPQSFYGQTKYAGEKPVLQLRNKGLVIRIANPYGGGTDGKIDFVRKIVSLLAQGKDITAPDDQIFTPTYVDDIAFAIDKLIHTNASGLYHVVGSTACSPYQAALDIAEKFNFDSGRIKAGKAREFFAGRAPRPLRCNLKNDKITACGVKMQTFVQGLTALKSSLAISL